MQKEYETINTLPPEIIQTFEENVYVRIANSIYIIREKKGEKVYEIPSLEFGNCQVLNDVLYVNFKNANGEVLQALQVNDKAPLWTSLRKNPLLSPPLIKKDKIYLCEKEGISALNSRDGMQNWQCAIDAWFLPLITIQNEMIYALSQGEHPTLYLLDSNIGTILRSLSLSPLVSIPVTSLIATPQAIILDTSTGCIVWDVQNGSFAWQYHDTAINPMIGAKNGYIYLSYPQYRLASLEDLSQSRNSGFEGEGFLAALHEDDGSIAWKYHLRSDGQAGMSTLPIVADEVVYVGMSTKAGQCSLIALHSKSGLLLWNYQMRGSTVSSPFVQGDVVYIGLDDGYVYAFHTNTGSLLWKTFVSTSYQMGINADGIVERLP